MRRRTLILALLIALGVSSGAFGQPLSRVIPIDLHDIDTADFVSGDVATKVNDSILFTTMSFGIPANTSRIITRLVRVTPDTVMDGGGDSVLYDIQTKFDNTYDSTWMRVGGSVLVAESAINTTGGSPRVIVPVDSLGSFGDIARVRFWYVTEEDSLRAHDQTGTVPLNGTYKLLVNFKPL